jgi:hypothetical protein
MHGETLSWREALLRTYFDGALVLHRAGWCSRPISAKATRRREHALFSVTKSLVGTLAALAVHEAGSTRSSRWPSCCPSCARPPTATPPCAR